MYSISNNQKKYLNIKRIPIRISIPIELKLSQIHKTEIELIQDENRDQKDIINKIVNDQLKYNSVILSLYTGFGKTIIGLYLASYFKRTLVIISYNVLYDQWMDKIKQYNINYVDVVKVISELNKKNIINSNYDMIIVDECHHEFKRVTELIGFYEIKQLVGLSATPLDADMTNRIFKNILTIPLKSRPYTVQPVKLHFPCVLLKRNRQGQIDYNSAMNEMNNNIDRLNAIVNFINERLHLKSLILVRNISTINFLKKNIKTDDLYVFYGEIKELNIEKNIVIGTYPKMGVGVDTHKFKALYFLDNKKDIIQAEGRCRNDDIIIFDFIDKDGFFANHYYNHLKFYRLRQATILNPINLK